MPRVQDLVQLSFSPNQAKHLCDPNGGWYQPFVLSNGLYQDETWTYASSTTVTVTTDATTRYSKGMKVRLKQGGGYKYFYIVAVAATTLTLAAGSVYTVANSTITDLEVSSAEMPFGFPDHFDWAPAFNPGSGVSYSVVPTVSLARFTIKGQRCFCSLSANTGTTNGAASPDVKITGPVASAYTSEYSIIYVRDAGTRQAGKVIQGGGTSFIIRLLSDANWAIGANCEYSGMFSYEI